MRTIVNFSGRIFSRLSMIVVLFVAGVTAQGQKSSSITIHDSSPGGEGATASLRNEIKSALEREKPCVETMDDQDLRDAIQDERDRALLEGGDSSDALKAIGERWGSNVVVSVKGIPGPGGSTSLSARGLDMRTARMVANEIGNDGSERQMAENLVRSLGPYLADQCKPHWVGTIRYEFRWDETKQKNDAGAMRAAVRNTKRTLTETSNWSNLVKATLLPPSDPKSVNSPMAMVIHRMSMIYTKKSSTTGELYCRVAGRNPFWTGYTADYSETTTQIGQGTDKMPIFIEIDDKEYRISVNAPKGKTIGKTETSRSESNCDGKTPPADITAREFPESELAGTSFEVRAPTPKSATNLSGSKTLPDGKTKITWDLRLVKPK